MLVSNDRTPESKEAETTIVQSTADITAAVPIVATAVCATVFIALTPAAFNQIFFLFVIKNHPFKPICARM